MNVVFKLVFIMVRNNVRNIWKTTHLERRIIRLPSQIIKPELFSKTPLRQAGVQMSEEFIISICGRLAKWDDYRKRFSSTCQYWEKFLKHYYQCKIWRFSNGENQVRIMENKLLFVLAQLKINFHFPLTTVSFRELVWWAF